jgi:putative tryptophan/tyrosine transport system substrate-binding protein
MRRKRSLGEKRQICRVLTAKLSFKTEPWVAARKLRDTLCFIKRGEGRMEEIHADEVTRTSRRDLIALLSGAVAAWFAVGVRAQPGKTFRLGILVNTRNTALDELLKGLRDHGYVEGQNLIVESRFSEGVGERWPDLAAELVALKVDAIVVQTTPAALAAKQATSTIPIVIISAIDPVGAGLANSLARPGGNVTGLATLQPEISAKALSLLKEAVPTLSRVAVLWNASNPALAPIWRAVDAAARSMGLVLLSQPVREPQDFAATFAAIASQRPEGFLVLVDALVFQYLRQIVEFTVRERFAAVSTLREFAASGGLMSYGANLTAMQRKAADYVDRVLKGENPAELPFEQPTTFELVINLKAAKALDLTVPQLLLARADEVIE